MPLMKLGRPTIYILLMIYVSMLAMVAGSLVYTNHVAQRSAQSWCDVVVTLDDAYRTTPPTTEVGRKLAREMHDLRKKLNCEVSK